MWRFKTEAEFLEYGIHWKENLMWLDEMDILFGKSISDEEKKDIQEFSSKHRCFEYVYDVENRGKKFSLDRYRFSVTNHMITDKPLPDPVTPDAAYRFKTEEEFIEEYGKDRIWRSEVGWTNSGTMDHLFGLPIDDSIAQSTFKRWNVGVSYPDPINNNYEWSINQKMITSITKSITQPPTPQENVTSNPSRAGKPIEVQRIDFTVPEGRRITGSAIYYRGS